MNLIDNDKSILANSRIGYEFEFFSKLSTDDVRTALITLLDKKIVKMEKSHSDFQPTKDIWKIEPDFSGGKKMMEIVTGPLPYEEAKSILTKMLKWISKNGYTTDRTSIHINISFNDTIGKSFLTHMDTLKYILDFDESTVYKLFPKREKSVYAKSIKFLNPANKYSLDTVETISPKNFILPNTKYYGINFSKLIKSYLEFRYIGGAKYEERKKDIQILIDYFITSLHKSISEKGYSRENKKEINRILSTHEKLIKSYRSFKDFKESFPEITFLADLRHDDIYTTLYYDKVKDHIYKILSETNFRKGLLNYDSNNGKLQIKEANITRCYSLDNVDILDSNISGTITNCDIFYSKFDDTDLDNCNVFQDTELVGCKIKNSYINKTITLKDCYIFGKHGVTNGQMIGGIFREGKITDITKFSPETEIIEFEKIQ